MKAHVDVQKKQDNLIWSEETLKVIKVIKVDISEGYITMEFFTDFKSRRGWLLRSKVWVTTFIDRLDYIAISLLWISLSVMHMILIIYMLNYE